MTDDERARCWAEVNYSLIGRVHYTDLSWKLALPQQRCCPQRSSEGKDILVWLLYLRLKAKLAQLLFQQRCVVEDFDNRERLSI